MKHDCALGWGWGGARAAMVVAQACWAEKPSDRPRLPEVVTSIRGMLGKAAEASKLSRTLSGVRCVRSRTTWHLPCNQLGQKI